MEFVVIERVGTDSRPVLILPTKPQADEIVRALQRRGISAWVVERRPGGVAV